MTVKEWCLFLVLPIIILSGMAKCSYKNYVTYKTEHAAENIATGN